jgi:hypothetical protein
LPQRSSVKVRTFTLGDAQTLTGRHGGKNQTPLPTLNKVRRMQDVVTQAQPLAVCMVVVGQKKRRPTFTESFFSRHAKRAASNKIAGRRSAEQTKADFGESGGSAATPVKPKTPATNEISAKK